MSLDLDIRYAIRHTQGFPKFWKNAIESGKCYIDCEGERRTDSILPFDEILQVDGKLDNHEEPSSSTVGMKFTALVIIVYILRMDTAVVLF